ncbi:MAG TPA: ABC transporter permease [Candidatus Methylomirabilis sp.]|nr:ABC transporter permease [Candidatus Methylomirabilis sp.]
MALLSRLKALLGIHRLERDLDDELRSHLEMRTRDNVAAGMSLREARYDAQRRFGNSTLMKEDTRSMDIVGWLETTGQNLRYAARMLRRTPGFTLVAILTLALGIGANVAIFTVVHAVLLRPLPFPHPEQLVRVYDDIQSSSTHNVGMSVPELWDLRDRSGVFQDISVIYPADANITGGDQPHRVQFIGTNANYFTMLGVRAQLGRTFLPSDALPGFSEPVVLSDAYWRRSYGADPSVIGRKIRIDSDLYIIAGVMPPNFRHPGPALGSDVDLWATTGFAAAPFPDPPIRAARLLPGAMGRLKLGLAVAQAQAQLNAFVAQLTRQFPDEYPAAAGWSVRLVPVQQDLVGNVRTELFVLLAAVAFVLLIACVNLANLLLARSANRQREMAIRISLGASRSRLLGQLLTESTLLASISGAIALLTVVILKTSLLRLAPADLPRLSEVSLSPAILTFAFFLSIFTGVIFGLVPALQSARSNQISSLREGTRGSGTSKRQMRISRLLVGSEIALSLILLIGAGLLVRSFWQLLQVRPGFEPRHLVTAKLWLAVPNNPNQDPYFKPDKRADFHQEILRRISAIPGVEQAALGSPSSLPMDARRIQSPFVLDIPSFNLERVPVAEVAAVTPAYFSVLETPLIAGRFFSDSDDTKGQQVALIDETLAHRYWPNSVSDAVGQHLRLGAPSARATTGRSPWATIVGVVGNIKSDGFDAATAPHVYRPVYQTPPYSDVVYLRTSADISTLGESVRAAVQQVDPTIPVFSVRTMDFVVSTFLAERRFSLELLGVFAVAALLLASIGIYGVMAYTFSQRTNEIGIRVALGAQRRDILKIAFSEGATVVLFGLFAGLLGSLALTRFLQSMLFAVKPHDPATFAAIAALLAAVTLFACFIPARRATRVDPLVALRHE